MRPFHFWRTCVADTSSRRGRLESSHCCCGGLAGGCDGDEDEPLPNVEDCPNELPLELPNELPFELPNGLLFVPPSGLLIPAAGCAPFNPGWDPKAASDG